MSKTFDHVNYSSFDNYPEPQIYNHDEVELKATNDAEIILKNIASELEHVINTRMLATQLVNDMLYDVKNLKKIILN